MLSPVVYAREALGLDCTDNRLAKRFEAALAVGASVEAFATRPALSDTEEREQRLIALAQRAGVVGGAFACFVGHRRTPAPMQRTSSLHTSGEQSFGQLLCAMATAMQSARATRNISPITASSRSSFIGLPR
jgi:hypothetical protein